MNLLKPFKDLKLVNKDLRLAVIALFIFFVSEILYLESYLLYAILDGSSDLSLLIGIFSYRNFVSVISFLLLYLVIRNYSQVITKEKERYLISFAVIIFVFNYLFKFYFVERLFSLTSVGLYSFPDSVSDFLPFDWYYLSRGYTDFQSDYDPGWYRLQFVFVLISAISILTYLYFSLKFLRTNKVKLEIRENLRLLKQFFKSTKIRVILLVILMSFSLFGIQNIKANDYRSISYEAEFAQDDLMKFQEELKSANQKSFQDDKYAARKAAANKIFSSIASRDERIKDIDLSFWSSDLRVLKIAVIEWIVLWEKFLKEMSLQGYVEPGTLFDLNQKYAEVSKIGKSRAPELVADYSVDYWDEEFYPLVN